MIATKPKASKKKKKNAHAPSKPSAPPPETIPSTNPFDLPVSQLKNPHQNELFVEASNDTLSNKESEDIEVSHHVEVKKKTTTTDSDVLDSNPILFTATKPTAPPPFADFFSPEEQAMFPHLEEEKQEKIESCLVHTDETNENNSIDGGIQERVEVVDHESSADSANCKIVGINTMDDSISMERHHLKNEGTRDSIESAGGDCIGKVTDTTTIPESSLSSDTFDDGSEIDSEQCISSEPAKENVDTAANYSKGEGIFEFNEEQNIESSKHQRLPKESFKSMYPSAATVAANFQSETRVIVDEYSPNSQQSSPGILLKPHVNYEFNAVSNDMEMKYHHRMRSVNVSDSVFFEKLQTYLYIEQEIGVLVGAIKEQEELVDRLKKKIWSDDVERISAKGKCKDGVELQHCIKFKVAKYDKTLESELEHALNDLRHLRTSHASKIFFNRNFSFLHIEVYLDNLFDCPDVAEYIDSKGVYHDVEYSSKTYFDQYSSSHTSKFASPIFNWRRKLMHCIDVLFFFEREVLANEIGTFGCVPKSSNRGQIVYINGQKSTESRLKKIQCHACNHLNSYIYKISITCERCEAVIILQLVSLSTSSTSWQNSVKNFRHSLKKWIQQCLTQLVELNYSFSDRFFLLMHLLHLPHLSSERNWLLCFFQIPQRIILPNHLIKNIWTESLIDHYVALVTFLLHPEKIEKDRFANLESLQSSSSFVLCPSSSSSSIAGYCNSVMENIFRQTCRNSCSSTVKKNDEWLLVEDPIRSSFMYLSDDDYVALFHQFPNVFAFEQLFNSSQADVLSCFSRALSLLNEFCSALVFFTEFEQFTIELTKHMLCLIEKSIITKNSTIVIVPLIDQLCLAGLQGIVEAPNLRLRCYLSSFPFEYLSPEALWKGFQCIYLFSGIGSTNASLEMFSDCATWLTYIYQQNYRSAFHLQLLSMNEEEKKYSIFALAYIVSSRSTLNTPREDFHPVKVIAEIILTELFAVGFSVHFVESGDLAKKVQGHVIDAIQIICLAWPHLISCLGNLVESLSNSGASIIDENWIAFYKELPLQRWCVQCEDLDLMKKWLFFHDLMDSRSRLARFLIFRLNYDYTLSNPTKLFLSAELHRKMALLLMEVAVLYKNNYFSTYTNLSYQYASLWEGEMALDNWCWSVIFRLRFHEKNGTPLLPQICLDNHFSHEATLLRRYFSYYSHQGENFTLDKEEILPTGNQTTILGENWNLVDEEDVIEHINQYEQKVDEEVIVGANYINKNKIEPIVAFLVCQLTTHLYQIDKINRWYPLLVLLQNQSLKAVLIVLEPLVPRLIIQLEPIWRQCISDGNSPRAVFYDKFVSLKQDSSRRQLIQSLFENGYMNHTQFDYLINNSQAKKGSQLAEIALIAERSFYLHPLILPSLLHGSSEMNSSNLFYSVLSWCSWTFQKISAGLFGEDHYPELITQFTNMLHRQVADCSGHNEMTIAKYWLVVFTSLENKSTVWYCSIHCRYLIDQLIQKSLLIVARQEELIQFCLDIVTRSFDTFCLKAANSPRKEKPHLSLLSVSPSAKHPRKRILGFNFKGSLANEEVVKKNEGLCGFPLLGFIILLVEVRKEGPLFQALGHLLLQKGDPETNKGIEWIEKKRSWQKSQLTKELFSLGIDTNTSSSAYNYAHVNFTSLSQYKFYTVLDCVLALPVDQPCGILYWQLFFSLYFAQIDGDCFGFWLLNRSKYMTSKTKVNILREHLQEKLQALSTYFNTLSCEQVHKTICIELSHLYTAMGVWLANPNPNTWLHQVGGQYNEGRNSNQEICHFVPERLFHVVRNSAKIRTSLENISVSSVHHQSHSLLWLELCLYAPQIEEDGSLDKVDLFSMNVKVDISDCCLQYPRRLKLTRSAPVVDVKYFLLSHLERCQDDKMGYGNISEAVSQQLLMYLSKESLTLPALLYSEQLSQLISLDNELMETLPLLYSNHEKHEKIVKACDIECKGKIVLQFNYKEWFPRLEVEQKVSTIERQVNNIKNSCFRFSQYEEQVEKKSNIELIIECLGTNEMSFNLCIQLLYIQQTVLQLLTLSDPVLTEVSHKVGVSLFHFLIELDSSLTRFFPPIREILWSCIQQLGSRFIAQDQEETQKLLSVFVSDSARICLLSNCFNPGNNDNSFVQYFVFILSPHTADKIPLPDRLHLLIQFKVKDWLMKAPSFFERSSLLSVLSVELISFYGIKQEDNGCEIDTDTYVVRQQLLDFYCSILYELCNFYLADHMLDVVKLLVGIAMENSFLSTSQSSNSSSTRSHCNTPIPLVKQVWDAVLCLPVTKWQSVPLNNITDFLDFCTDHVIGLRWEKITNVNEEVEACLLHEWNMSNSTSNCILPSFLQLFSIGCNRISTSKQMNLLWQIERSFLEAIMCTLYQPATLTNPAVSFPPWPPGLKESTSELFENFFVLAANKYLCSSTKETCDVVHSRKFFEILQFALNKLVLHSSLEVTKVLQSGLLKLSWHDMMLTFDMLNYICEYFGLGDEQYVLNNCGRVFSDEQHETILTLVGEILIQVSWEKTITNLINQQTDNTNYRVSSLLKKVVQLFMYMIVKQNYRSPVNLFLEQLQGDHAKSRRMQLQNSMVFYESLPWHCLGKQDTIFLCEFYFHLLQNEVDMDIKCNLKEQYDVLILGINLLQHILVSSVDHFCKNNVSNRSIPLDVILSKFKVVLKLCYRVWASDLNEWKVGANNHSSSASKKKLMYLCRGVLCEGFSNFLSTMLTLTTFLSTQLDRHMTLVEQNQLMNCFRDLWQCVNLPFIELLPDVVISPDTVARIPKLPNDDFISWVSFEHEENEKIAQIHNHLGNVIFQLLLQFSRNCSGFESLVLKSICRTVASISLLTTLAEQSITKFVCTASASLGWKGIVSALEVPELSMDTFELECTSNSCVFTLLCHVLQALGLHGANDDARTCAENINYLKLLPKLMNWIQDLGSYGRDEKKFLYFVVEVMHLIHQQFKNVPLNFKKDQLHQLSKILLKLGEDRQTDGILGTIGLGTKSKYSFEFRFAVSSLGAFLRVQTPNNFPIRLDSSIDVVVTNTTEKILKSFENLKINGEYSHLAVEIDWVVNFVRDSQRSLADQNEFCIHLFSALFRKDEWMLRSCLM